MSSKVLDEKSKPNSGNFPTSTIPMRLPPAKLVIPLVKAKPELWDTNHVFYTDDKHRAKIWSEIATQLDSTVEVVKDKWFHLRSYFRLTCRRIAAAKKKGNIRSRKFHWRYYKDMLFLNDKLADLEVSLNPEHGDQHFPEAVIEDTDEYYVDGFFEGDSDESSPSSQSEHSVSNSIRQSDSAKMSQNLSEMSQPQCGQHRVDMNAGPHNLTVAGSALLQAHSSIAMDEDYHFLMSLLPSMQRVLPERKTFVRIKILQSIHEQEIKLVPNNRF